MGDSMAEIQTSREQSLKNATIGSSRTEEENSNCIDTLIWIGKTYYSKILGTDPGKPLTFSYPPKGMWPRDCYVHEAEIRGCCRKVPAIPNWLAPKKSRIFLAHQRGKRNGCACLFGYYVFRRAEMVVPWKGSPIEKGISLPHETTDFEALRSCGRRPNREEDTKAKYMVDSLAADIIDIFQSKLGSGIHTTSRKHRFFEQAVEDAGRIHRPSFTKPHNLIKNNANVRGELVLFDTIEKGEGEKKNEEYPIIARRPRAHFLGLARVDGEKLINEIREWYNNDSKCIVKIPYCGNGIPWTPADFAYEFGFNKRCAEEILRVFGGVLKRLSPGRSYTILNIGTFANNDGDLHFKPLVKCCTSMLG